MDKSNRGEESTLTTRDYQMVVGGIAVSLLLATLTVTGSFSFWDVLYWLAIGVSAVVAILFAASCFVVLTLLNEVTEEEDEPHSDGLQHLINIALLIAALVAYSQVA